jgi:hypothetical protein
MLLLSKEILDFVCGVCDNTLTNSTKGEPQMSMENDTVQIEITHEQGAVLNMALALFMNTIGDDIEGWKNKKESSMDKLFFLMGIKMEAGVVWRNLALAMGISEETIQEHLEEQE